MALSFLPAIICFWNRPMSRWWTFYYNRPTKPIPPRTVIWVKPGKFSIESSGSLFYFLFFLFFFALFSLMDQAILAFTAHKGDFLWVSVYLRNAGGTLIPGVPGKTEAYKLFIRISPGRRRKKGATLFRLRLFFFSFFFFLLRGSVCILGDFFPFQ